MVPQPLPKAPEHMMLEDTRGSLRDELEEALLSMRKPPAPQQQPFNSLRDEIQRIRAYSHENQ